MWRVSVGLICAAAAAQTLVWEQSKALEGYSLSYPKGWTVETVGGDAVLVREPAGAAAVLIQPFFLKNKSSATACLKEAPARIAAHFPGAQLGSFKALSGSPVDEATAALSYTAAGKPGRAAAICSIYKSSGMLYVMGAAASRYPELKLALLRILRSFVFVPGKVRAETGVAAELAYERWADPLEGAFSIEVPRGWQTKGGMFRFASVDTRAAVEVLSPDGRTRITFGDAAVPPHTLPNQMLEMAGLREGSWYSPGYGVRMFVRRYLTGVDFASEYVQSMTARNCPGLKISSRRDRPDLAKQLGQVYAQYGGFVSQQLTVGDVAFECAGANPPLRGYYFAGTQLTTAGGNGLWHVPHLGGYIAPATSVATAEAVAQRLLASIQLNPQWVAGQQNVTAQTSRIVTETNNHVSRIINETYWSRQAVVDDLSRRWSNTILGQTDVRDPVTGETWKATAGHNYYWRQEGTGAIVGTRTYDRPDINFRPLEEW